MTASVDAPSLRGLFALLAAATLGYALQVSNGTLHPEAFTLVSGVLVVTIAAAFWRDRALAPPWSGLPIAVGFGALALYFAIHFTTAPGVYLRGGGELFIEHHRLAAVAALLAGASLTSQRQTLLVVLTLITAFLLGLWLLQASPAPMIDVWYWHRAGYEALAAGTNPYAITMPNIYGHTQWFAPGLADNTRVFVGYPYPPVTMLLGGLGHLVKQDYRYFNLLAQLGAGAFIAFSRPGRVATIAAIVFLFQPRGLFVLEQGWTESLSALGLAATVFFAARRSPWLPWVFGVMLGLKQYFVFALPLLPLLLPGADRKTALRFLLKAAIIPAVITLPFLLWDPGAFFNSVVAFQAKQPFRADALSVMSWLVSKGGPMLPLNLSFGLAGLAAAAAWWKGERSAAGFAAALALTLLFFFFFAKQAFTNYYYLIVACLCAAAATAGSSQRSTAGSGTPT